MAEWLLYLEFASHVAQFISGLIMVGASGYRLYNDNLDDRTFILVLLAMVMLK